MAWWRQEGGLSLCQAAAYKGSPLATTKAEVSHVAVKIKGKYMTRLTIHFAQLFDFYCYLS